MDTSPKHRLWMKYESKINEPVIFNEGMLCLAALKRKEDLRTTASCNNSFDVTDHL